MQNETQNNGKTQPLIQQWIEKSGEPCEWFATDTEVLVIAPSARAANRLWQDLDWNTIQPNIAGRAAAIWLKGRLYAASKNVKGDRPLGNLEID